MTGIDWSFGGGVTGLLGPNGAGKSTLLSLLVTITSPASGSVGIGGYDLSDSDGRAKARALLGFVPQRFTLAPEMRVRDTVAYAGWVNGLADAQCDAAADAALSLAGLVEKSRSRVRALSGGQRQRLGIACALAHRPTVLVLDEPTVGLDPGQRLRVRKLIAELGTDADTARPQGCDRAGQLTYCVHAARRSVLPEMTAAATAELALFGGATRRAAPGARRLPGHPE